MNSGLMQKALERLDQVLLEKGHQDVHLLVGGGGAFALAYQVPLHTADIDAVLFRSRISEAEFDRQVKEAARSLDIAPDWLNPYFGTFLFCLPADYGDRLRQVYAGKALSAYALGLEDLLVMKCFAGREKDMLHAKILIRKGADLSFVEGHLEMLLAKKIPGAAVALDFLREAEDQVGA